MARFGASVLGVLLVFSAEARAQQCSATWVNLGDGSYQYTEYCAVHAELHPYLIWWFDEPPNPVIGGELDHSFRETGGEVINCNNDSLTDLIYEYIERNICWVPFCHAFKTSGGSTYFSWAELTQHEKNHHYPTGLVMPELWTGLDRTRGNYGEAIRITSGYRCPNGNAQLPGSDVTCSKHMLGQAADMVDWDEGINQTIWTQIADAANAAGAGWIEPYNLANDHVHAEWY